MKSLNRILIIEDSKSFSAVIVRLLKEEFETKVLHELDNGLEECQSFMPDIILLDIMFPGDDINKIELFARRDRPGWKCIGNENPSTIGQDIRDSLEILKSQQPTAKVVGLCGEA